MQKFSYHFQIAKTWHIHFKLLKKLSLQPVLEKSSAKAGAAKEFRNDSKIK
jgi:hypothetical protein